MPAKIFVEDPQAIVDAYVNGESEIAITRRMGFRSRKPVRNALVDAGVELRGRSAANRNRMSKLSAEDRRELATAAQKARKGRTNSLEQRCATAKTRERAGIDGRSPGEEKFAQLLRAEEIVYVAQLAVGPYNLDFGLTDYSIGVEILGGGWHNDNRHAQRTPYVLNAGWHLLFIWSDKRREAEADALRYLVSFIEETCRDPAAVRQYRVIRGDGEFVTGGSSRDNTFSIRS